MKRPPWNARRRIVHGTLLFCAGMVIWLIWKGEDTNLASAVANACFFLAGSVIGAYVFGATWDDRNVMQHMGAEAYQDYEPTLTAHPGSGFDGPRADGAGPMTALLVKLVGERAAGVISSILGFTIPIPIIVILAALAWVQFDKSSAIRQAVNERVTEMVAGAEIAALEAELAAQVQIADREADAAQEARRRLTVEADARARLAMRLAAIQTENEILNDDLADLLSRPVDGGCAVDPDLLGRLRGR